MKRFVLFAALLSIVAGWAVFGIGELVHPVVVWIALGGSLIVAVWLFVFVVLIGAMFWCVGRP